MKNHVDVIRLLLISQAGLTIGLAFLITATHLGLWFSMDATRRGRLPVQVAAVALSHAMLVFYAATTVAERLGEPLSWRTPFLVAAMVISDVALIAIIRVERARIRSRRRVGHPLRRVDDL